MEKCDIEKGQLYEAEIIGVKGRQQVQVVSILDKTCTVEVKNTGEIAVAKIASLSKV